MSNTKIVLNRQSDLILDNAQITAPVGIVKADIPELVGDLSNLVVADDAEKLARKAGDASLEAKHNAEMSTEVAARIAGDAAIQAEVDALEVEHAADVSTAAENLAAEASRAQAAEGSLATALANEVAATDSDFAAMDAAYKAADASMETKHNAEMSAETSARVAGDVLLQTNIDAEKARIDAILDASTADSDSFAEIVALINSVDTENDQAFASYVLSNDAALSTEVARAGAAESSLEAALAAEISSTDADLSSLEVKHDAEMSTEASIRVAVDAAQDAALSQEVIDRQSGDNAIQANLNNEISDRIAQDQLQAANLSAETSRAQAAEGSLESALNAEASATDADFAAMDIAYKAADSVEKAAREAADAAEASTRTLAINAEQSARIAADNAEAAARAAADNSLEVKHDAEMSTEVAARIAGDAAEATAREAAISTETAAREAAISTEASAREFADNAEAAVRAAADGVLQSNIDAEKARIDAILDASEADKDSFAEIVSLINSVDTENDTAFAAYVLSNDAALSTEVARAESAEASLESTLAREVTDLSEKLRAEKSERQAGDAELDGKIADIISNTDITSMDSFSEVSAELAAQYMELSNADDDLMDNILGEKDDRTAADNSIIASANAALEALDNNTRDILAFAEDNAPYMAGFNELPDGVATVFTTDINAAQIVFLNGLMQLQDVDYTFVAPRTGDGGTVTFASAPAATDKLNIYGVAYSRLVLGNVNPVTAVAGSTPTSYIGTLIFDTEVSTGSTITALAYDAEGKLVSGSKVTGNVSVNVAYNIADGTPNSVDLSFTTDAIVAKFEVLVDGVVYGEVTDLRTATNQDDLGLRRPTGSLSNSLDGILNVDGEASREVSPSYDGSLAQQYTYSATFVFDTEVSTGSTITAIAYDATNTNLSEGTTKPVKVIVVDNGDGTVDSVDLSFATATQPAKFVVLVDGTVYGEVQLS